MTEADLQLAQLFRTAEAPPPDPAFADQVMRQVAAEQRTAWLLRLSVQAALAVAAAGLTYALPAFTQVMGELGLDPTTRMLALAAGLTLVFAVAARPFLSRLMPAQA